MLKWMINESCEDCPYAVPNLEACAFYRAMSVSNLAYNTSRSHKPHITAIASITSTSKLVSQTTRSPL